MKVILTTNIKKIDCFLPRNKLNVYQGENKKELEFNKQKNNIEILRQRSNSYDEIIENASFLLILKPL